MPEVKNLLNTNEFVEVWFTDILGNLKTITVSREIIENETFVNFDGSSVEGFARINESDMSAVLDFSTFQTVFLKNGNLFSRIFCDIEKDKKPYEGDPRFILKKQLKNMEEICGANHFYVGPEIEFFYLGGIKDATTLDHGGYFDHFGTEGFSALSKIIEATAHNINTLNINVEAFHHEVAPSQYEIDLKYDDALKMADNIMTVKAIIKRTATENGVHATFMPKPINGVNGSGMHVHQSLFKGNKNLFFDMSNKYHLSQLAIHYIAGLLEHAAEISIIVSQWANSYKRLVPGYEAPVYITWGRQNRSTLIRIPDHIKPSNVRVEYRSPDPASNPYLAFAVMLAAGLDGIERELHPPEPLETNLFENNLTSVKTLPENLGEAIKVAQRSEFLKEALGEHAYVSLLENKQKEWDEYRTHVSQFEIKKYLPIL